MRATGYYSPRGRGASGLGLYYGTFAVDPTLIPYGTKVYIVSTDGKFVYGWAIATDTGSFIHNNRMQVDLFYETYAESVANGVKEVYVYVP
jgi:3D (Asp-Asp-Asp) domain-containing protein